MVRSESKSDEVTGDASMTHYGELCFGKTGHVILDDRRGLVAHRKAATSTTADGR